NLDNKNFSDSFYSELMDAIRELKANEAVRGAAASLFKGYKETDGKSPEFLSRLLEFMTKTHDAKAMESLHVWTFTGAWDMRKKYLPQTRQYVRTLLEMGASKAKVDREFY